MTDLNTITRRELSALPHRPWNQESVYKALLILPARTKHSSGYAQIIVIGIKEDDSMEIAVSCPDDLAWITGQPEYEGRYGLKTDCLFKSKCLRFWHPRKRFRVGCDLSSVDITLIPVPSAA